MPRVPSEVEPQPAPRRVGTIWTLSPDQPLVAVPLLVEARLSRLGMDLAGALADAAGIDPEEVRQRLSSGRRCYAAWVGQRLAAYGWVSFGEEYVGELDLCLTLQPGEAYIWDCFTLPAFRQKHLYSALLIHMAGELRAECGCQLWIGADWVNQPSQKGIDRAGFLRVLDLAEPVQPGERRYEILPYPGVPEELVMQASRVFFTDLEKQ